MKKLFLLLATVLFLSFSSDTVIKNVKCMILMKNYTGEGAYIVISLLNPDGKYEKTLYVYGKDKEWYNELSSWWKFQGRIRKKLDGISGETIKGGQRSMNVFQVEESKLNKGYKIRFETAVESKNYYSKDIEFDLTTENINKKYNGKGFIKYIRLMAHM